MVESAGRETCSIPKRHCELLHLVELIHFAKSGKRSYRILTLPSLLLFDPSLARQPGYRQLVECVRGVDTDNGKTWWRLHCGRGPK